MMLFKKVKDIKFRQKFDKIEKLRKVRSFLITNLLNRKESVLKRRVLMFVLKEKFKINSISKVKITRRCVLTNRSRAIIRPFNISRSILRELMQFSILPGYSKAVW